MKQRSLFTTMTCIAAFALAASTTSMANVLTNPGFETDAVLNAAPVAGATGWTPQGNANTASANNNPTRTGIGSLQLVGPGGFAVPLVAQIFAATPGQTWNFEGYMLTPSTLPADATFGLLKIVWMDAGNVELQPGSAIVGTANNGGNPGVESTPFLNSGSATNTWVFTRAAGVAPAGTTQVRLIPLFVDQSAGTGYFDDLQSTNATPTNPPPVVINYPTNNAPTPTNLAATVLSMYNSSATYTDHAGINWYAGWSGNPGGNADYTITNTGAVVKKYLGLNYAGVEFYTPNQINAGGYTTLHVDIWTPNANQFGIQLVSLAGGTQAGQVNFLPAGGLITSNGWVSLNIPLSQFTAANPSLILTNLEQLLWIDNMGGGVQNGNFYIDNVYFYSNAVAPPIVLNYPTNAAPTPTNLAASVVALYNSASNYTTVPIDTWLTGWSGATYSDYTITNAGNRVVKRYGSLNFAGVEFFNPKINASGMNTFHIDLWTPNANKFSVKLVSFAPGAAEYEVVYTNNVIVTNNWVSLDIPISAFTSGNPAMDFSQLGQLLFINNNPGGPQFGTFFIDNVYFYSNAVVQPPVANYPTNAAPTPTHLAANVVSLYNSASNYTTVPIDTWLTGWSGASYTDYTITNAGNRVVKRYSALNFAGVEFFNPKINASGMTTFHVDLWTPNANKFSVKLVSFAPGAQEYEVVFTNNVIVSNNWVSLDIPISTFTTGQPAMDFSQLAQLLFINNNPGGPQFGTFFIDNVYFYAPTQPTVLSPAVSGNNFTAQSASQVGINYVLQGTPVLAPATWSNLQTNAGTGGTLNFSVPVAPGDPKRFFRIKAQ